MKNFKKIGILFILFLLFVLFVVSFNVKAESISENKEDSKEVHFIYDKVSPSVTSFFEKVKELLDNCNKDDTKETNEEELPNEQEELLKIMFEKRFKFRKIPNCRLPMKRFRF